jgi:acyl-coenzyme A synthetase/AMP-(fatty) acid ligase
LNQILDVPSLDWILEAGEQQPYPYNKTFEQAVHDVIVIIHTSGTTSVPKPIYHTNGMWTAMGNHETLSQRHWPRGLSHDSWMGRTTLDCCAPQWLGGLINTIISPVYYNSPCVVLPSDAANISPELFKKLMSLNIIEGIKCPPQTIATLYEDPESRALLKSLKSICKPKP